MKSFRRSFFHRTKNLDFSLIKRQRQRKKRYTSSKMIKNIARKASLLMIFLTLIINETSATLAKSSRNKTIDDNKELRVANVESNKLSGREAARLELLQYNNRWDRESMTTDNEIDTNLRPFKSQRDYSCGRPVGHRKYKDFFSREPNLQVSRAKYRPLEIRMPRIIGGDETAPGEFPWTVSVKLNGQPICGGSLIEKSWILTAAHCVVGYNPKNLTVRLGAYRIKDMSETQTLDVPVSMFIVHKEYSMPRPFSNDIALLKLNEQIEFTDFIIPICLPIEDQAPSTSPITTISDDYLSKFDTGRETSEDTGGIVVSTKMSDTDIADCFNKLEQNYLTSIGLGPIVESSTEQTVAAPSNQQLPLARPFSTPAPPPPSVLPLEHQPQSHLFSYGSMLDPLYTDQSSSSSSKDRRLNKMTFMSQTKPAGQHFEGQPHFSLPANSIDSSYGGQNGDYIYYGVQWKAKNDDTMTEDSSYDNEIARKEAIKLSRLPISKELLEEIQSVGSGPMPSLDLDLEKGDLVAMASDLTPTQPAISNNVANSDAKPSKLIKNQFFRSQDGLQSIEENQVLPTQTEYSGLDGIVVGWGWVRELDGDEQVNNKGYPSVTLQKVKLPILRNNVCEAWFQSQSKKITLLPSQFCAGFNSGGKDACRGDSGGPMVVEDNSNTGRYKLIGIVSAGIGCARPSLPGLYTRVASFIPWINAQLIRY